MPIEIDLIQTLLLLIAGFASGFLNVTAGGGSALTLPLLIFLGLDSATANGTNRVAIVVQSLSAIASFKSDKYSEFGKSMKLAAITLPGGILGAVTALQMNDEIFNKVLGVVMIVIIISMLIPTPKKGKGQEVPPNFWTFAAMFGVGLYGGFIQVGVGFLMMAILQKMLKMELTRVNMHKVFIAFVFTTPAMIVFMISGHVNYLLGIVLAIGNAIGALVAAKISVRKGEKFIKIFLILSMIIMAIKLFDFI